MVSLQPIGVWTENVYRAVQNRSGWEPTTRTPLTPRAVRRRRRFDTLRPVALAFRLHDAGDGEAMFWQTVSAAFLMVIAVGGYSWCLGTMVGVLHTERSRGRWLMPLFFLYPGGPYVFFGTIIFGCMYVFQPWKLFQPSGALQMITEIWEENPGPAAVCTGVWLLYWGIVARLLHWDWKSLGF